MENIDQIIDIDSVRFDGDNQEFKLALDYALLTNKNIYLTGKAGTGKTTFLKYLKRVTTKSMVVLAPTGVAAINAGGETIHSFFQIQPSVYVPNDSRLRTEIDPDDPYQKTIFSYLKYNKTKISLINNLETIVIDEISMVRSDMLDVIDSILRAYRNSEEVFGGVQMIFIGDVYQLPPIVKNNEKEIIFANYKSEFFFHSKVMEKIMNEDLISFIELKKIYRQKDANFVQLLNKIRVNDMYSSDFELLDSKLDTKNKDKDKKNQNHIILTTTNVKVKYINDKKLAALPSKSKIYKADIRGIFSEKDRPTSTSLELKVGAQVIFVKNDKERRFHNGKIGVVTNLYHDSIEVVIETDDGYYKDIIVSQETWKNVSYSWNQENNSIEEAVLGTFAQFPVKLAWAITVHKSQGMTFERVVADIGNSFDAGQVYVALSRCTSLDGLTLSSKITAKSIITDPRVAEFSEIISKKNAAPLTTEDIRNASKSQAAENKSQIQLVQYEEEEFYGKDSISSLKRKLIKKENEFQKEIAKLNRKNRELKDTVKKLENELNLLKEEAKDIAPVAEIPVVNANEVVDNHIDNNNAEIEEKIIIEIDKATQQIKLENKEKNRTIREQKQLISQLQFLLRNQIEEDNKIIKSLESQSQTNKEIDALQSKITKLREKLDKKDKEIVNKDKEIANKDKEIIYKDGIIKDLSIRCASIKDKEKAFNKLENSINSLKVTNTTLEEQVNTLIERLIEKDKEIESLKEKSLELGAENNKLKINLKEIQEVELRLNVMSTQEEIVTTIEEKPQLNMENELPKKKKPWYKRLFGKGN